MDIDRASTPCGWVSPVSPDATGRASLRWKAMPSGPRPDRLRRSALAWLAAVLVLVGIVPTARAEDAKDKGPQYRVTDVSLVYVGNPRLFKKPCVVDADRIYKAIPEYQEIVEKNLTDRDVRYHFLMKKASDKFSRAVRALAKDLEYDLVSGLGSVQQATTDAPAVPVGTDAAISRLPA